VRLLLEKGADAATISNGTALDLAASVDVPSSIGED
jgi:hypothetical protein